MKYKSPENFKADSNELRTLLLGMKSAYTKGENAMDFARKVSGDISNTTIATLIAYDLQAGSYISGVRENPNENLRWCNQLADILNTLIPENGSILEVGCGEATTLSGVIQKLKYRPNYALGLDISWSRCAEGYSWLKEKEVPARLFVADLFNIPLDNESVDIVYTSHSLEPNGGREEDAIKELMRVARYAVALVEPIYELASLEAQSRMRSHGYVRSLKLTAERLGAKISEYRLLENISNPLNPSGLILIEKGNSKSKQMNSLPSWRCPITRTAMVDLGDVFYGRESGLGYPVLRGVPLLREEHGIVSSKIIK